jgi:haloacetate dehalogenase
MFEGFEHKRITTNGVEINLVQGGSGPPMLLLHGYPQTHVEWHKVAPVLAEKYTVVATDLRGYGDSAKPPCADDDFTMFCKRTTGDDQVAVMAELGFDTFHLVGHDRGGRVAHRMARDYPAKVKTLTSVDVLPLTAAFENMDASLSYAWFHWHLMRQPAPFPETLIYNSAETVFDFILDTWTTTPDAITPGARAEYWRCFNDPETIRANCMDYRGVEHDLAHDSEDAGKKLTCPVLMIWGGNMPKRPGWLTGRSMDPLAMWADYAEDVRGRSLECGHFLPEEAPEETAAEILGFLEGRD